MTDQLLFLDTHGQRIWMAGWTGPWPPPKRLTVMIGRQSGYMSVVEIESVDPEALRLARALGPEEIRFKLRNASHMAEAAPEDAHWFRGAEYVPESDDA